MLSRDCQPPSWGTLGHGRACGGTQGRNHCLIRQVRKQRVGETFGTCRVCRAERQLSLHGCEAFRTSSAKTEPLQTRSSPRLPVSRSVSSAKILEGSSCVLIPHTHSTCPTGFTSKIQEKSTPPVPAAAGLAGAPAALVQAAARPYLVSLLFSLTSWPPEI